MHMGVNRLYRESYQESPVASRATPGRPASALQFLFRPTAACSPTPTSGSAIPRKERSPALQLYANRNRGGRKAGTEPSACSCLGAWRATGGRPWTVQDRTLRRTLKGERRHSAYTQLTARVERPIEGARRYTHPAFAPCRVMLAVRSRRPGSRAWRPPTTSTTTRVRPVTPVDVRTYAPLGVTKLGDRPTAVR